MDIEPGNHACEPPQPPEEFCAQLNRNSDPVVWWSCPVCRATWRGSPEFDGKGPSGDKVWRVWIKWRSWTPSGQRWKRRERKRLKGLAHDRS